MCRYAGRKSLVHEMREVRRIRKGEFLRVLVIQGAQGF
jgi:hypothetical protein